MQCELEIVPNLGSNVSSTVGVCFGLWTCDLAWACKPQVECVGKLDVIEYENVFRK